MKTLIPINTICTLFAALCVAATVCKAATVPTIATGDFIGDSGTRNYGSKIGALVTAELASDTNVATLDRSEITKALGEQALGISGLVNSTAAAKIGQITGAKILISGDVMMIDKDRLVIIANLIGTENARLFCVKVEGPAVNLIELCTALSGRIVTTILSQSSNLIVMEKESSTARIKRIVKSISGTNRPSVSINFYHPRGRAFPSFTANTEMGVLLQKSGFPVVDEKSDRKPDIEISGVVDVDGAQTPDGIHTEHAVVEMKVHDRQTGMIVAMDREETTAVDASKAGAQRSAQALAVDELAVRLLPLLAK